MGNKCLLKEGVELALFHNCHFASCRQGGKYAYLQRIFFFSVIEVQSSYKELHMLNAYNLVSLGTMYIPVSLQLTGTHPIPSSASLCYVCFIYLLFCGTNIKHEFTLLTSFEVQVLYC